MSGFLNFFFFLWRIMGWSGKGSLVASSPGLGILIFFSECTNFCHLALKTYNHRSICHYSHQDLWAHSPWTISEIKENNRSIQYTHHRHASLSHEHLPSFLFLFTSYKVSEKPVSPSSFLKLQKSSPLLPILHPSKDPSLSIYRWLCWSIYIRSGIYLFIYSPRPWIVSIFQFIFS